MEMTRIKLRYKDLNARGNGSQTTRRLRLPDGTHGWASDVAENIEGHWSSGTYLAADRSACQRGMVPVGTIVLDFETPFRGGSKAGSAKINAGTVGLDTEGKTEITWGLSQRRKGDVWQVQVDGEWLEV